MRRLLQSKVVVEDMCFFSMLQQLLLALETFLANTAAENNSFFSIRMNRLHMPLQIVDSAESGGAQYALNLPARSSLSQVKICCQMSSIIVLIAERATTLVAAE
jgi:hypothetical protein